MSRTGITFEDVQKAILKLKKQNLNITIDNVRCILKTGSNTTISKYINLYRCTITDPKDAKLTPLYGLYYKGYDADINNMLSFLKNCKKDI